MQRTGKRVVLSVHSHPVQTAPQAQSSVLFSRELLLVSSPSAELQRRMVLFQWPLGHGLAPLHCSWSLVFYVTCRECYHGSCRSKLRCLAALAAQREHYPAPYSWADVGLLLKLPELLLSRSGFVPLPSFGVHAVVKQPPQWAAAKQRSARVRSTRAARTRQAGAPGIASPFLTLSLFILLSLPGSPASSRRGQWGQRPLIWHPAAPKPHPTPKLSPCDRCLPSTSNTKPASKIFGSGGEGSSRSPASHHGHQPPPTTAHALPFPLPSSSTQDWGNWLLPSSAFAPPNLPTDEQLCARHPGTSTSRTHAPQTRVGSP